MTLKELSQLYYLNREIEMDQARLAELQSRVGIAAQQIDGMPHATGNGESKVEKTALEIVDLQAIIAAKQIQCIHERARLERYIASIPDSLTRMIFTYRFVNGLSWAQVTDCIGGDNKEESIKKTCYRYLDKTENEKIFVLYQWDTDTLALAES